jgi:hypothetical protein
VPHATAAAGIARVLLPVLLLLLLLLLPVLAPVSGVIIIRVSVVSQESGSWRVTPPPATTTTTSSSSSSSSRHMLPAYAVNSS